MQLSDHVGLTPVGVEEVSNLYWNTDFPLTNTRFPSPIWTSTKTPSPFETVEDDEITAGQNSSPL